MPYLLWCCEAELKAASSNNFCPVCSLQPNSKWLLSNKNSFLFLQSQLMSYLTLLQITAPLHFPLSFHIHSLIWPMQLCPVFLPAFAFPAARLAADCINATTSTSAKSIVLFAVVILFCPSSENIDLDRFCLVTLSCSVKWMFHR